ncbi:MAG: hypothetical protein QOI67_896 [Gaiellaceae bacterium]|nr:hypothetical protein [Gaiellaceae bacterium]
MSFKRHLTAGLALTVGLIALTGSALAAPPSTPPGQEKKAEATVPPAESAQAEKNNGQEQKAADAQSSGINATTAGVKPSNDTDKNTWCKTGGSGASTTCTRNPHGTNPPDSSKRYGNGQTAAQIATSRGAPAGTDVYGPGNSQPHKVCGKNGHFIDVHAVKSYAGFDCTTATAATTTAQQQSQGTVTTSSNSSTSAGNSTGVTASTSQTGSTSGPAATGGVAGVSAGSGAPQSGGSKGEAGGVLGAFGVAGVAAGGVLPFTGFPLWLVVLVAIALIAIGSTLHRRGRPATRDLV